VIAKLKVSADHRSHAMRYVLVMLAFLLGQLCSV
jgi:hypothetical protein